MTVLESVGTGADQPSVVTELLDIEKNPAKPGYKLADPEPLILSHCEYDPCPFEEPHDQSYNCSPFNMYSEQIEKTLSQVCHLRLGLQELPKSKRVVAQRSILGVQRGRSHQERLGNLKGNKLKRWENVQDWKAQILEKEKLTGPPKGRGPERSRSRSHDRYRKLDEVDVFASIGPIKDIPDKLDSK
jgi:tRNA pseudouridine synthase